MDSPVRSLSKTLSWRIAAVFITAAVGFTLTRQWALALTLGTADTLVKLFLYYFHERLWNQLPFGRQPDGVGPGAAEGTQRFGLPPPDAQGATR